MASSLGIYLENNIIKYAKVSKEQDTIKVESFGIKFYDDDLQNELKQIINETYSFKVPISINLSGEMYNYFDMFALLNKKDLPKAIKTEFEMFCEDKEYNPNAFESRYALASSIEDKEKLKVIHISENKIELNKREQEFETAGLKNLKQVLPLPLVISNIANVKQKENIVIVNIEDKTTITTILDEKIYDIKILEMGSSDILEAINLKENSYSKSYEICKNTTIYTSGGQELGEDTGGHIADIMPVLYNIATEVKNIVAESFERINTVYITGTISVVNNIDLYFQEFISDATCKILRPYFMENVSRDINIKDYIEVNSAIALAMQGLGEGIHGINFRKQTLQDKLPLWMTADIGDKKNKKDGKESKGSNGKNININFNLKGKLDKTESILLRVAIAIVLFIVIFSVFSVSIQRQINLKSQDILSVNNDMQAQINNVKSDISKINSKASQYTSKIQEIEAINEKISENNQLKNAIPNLLNQIMFIIPKTVQITSIENTTDKHIVINAQSQKYEQLGIFISKIKTEPILTDVIASSGVKQGDIVLVTIEGDLL